MWTFFKHYSVHPDNSSHIIPFPVSEDLFVGLKDITPSILITNPTIVLTQFKWLYEDALQISLYPSFSLISQSENPVLIYRAFSPFSPS